MSHKLIRSIVDPLIERVINLEERVKCLEMNFNCIWKISGQNVDTGCGDTMSDYHSTFTYGFCPFCGKEIEAVKE